MARASYNCHDWKTGVIYADNTSESYGHDALGRLTSRTDSLGTRIYAYNNQGLLSTVTSEFGLERSMIYDIYDFAITNIDANGVVVMRRPLTRMLFQLPVVAFEMLNCLLVWFVLGGFWWTLPLYSLILTLSATTWAMCYTAVKNRPHPSPGRPNSRTTT